jgi:glycosyltransferase involved in cell wall biosynthesis
MAASSLPHDVVPLPATQVPVELPAPRECPIAQRAWSALESAEQGIAQLQEERTEAPTPSGSTRRTTLRVSVVIPVFNERDTVRQIVERVRQAACHHEIVIVDDCSTDGTRDLLLELEREGDVRVVLHGYNKGKGAALRTAFEQVRGDIVLIQDADLEYDPDDYARLLAPLERGEADVVFGSRFLDNPRQDPSWWHRLGNRVLTRLSNVTTGLRLTDMETCYKVFRAGALRGMPLCEQRFGFEPEFTAKLARRGCRVVEVPVSYHGRGYAEGKKINYRDGLRAIYCILRYAWVD